jgi:hypothetical protein
MMPPHACPSTKECRCGLLYSNIHHLHPKFIHSNSLKCAVGDVILLSCPRDTPCTNRIDKADELPVHNRKGVGNLQNIRKRERKGGGKPAVVPQGERSHCHGRRSPYSAFQKTTMCYKKCANKVQPFTFGAVPLFKSKKSDVLLSQ